MELVFGTRVRSNGRRLGSLAGLEFDPASSTVTRIIFSEDGRLGGHAHTRALEAVRVDGGSIHVEDSPSSSTDGQQLLLGRSTRVMRRGREAARVIGVELSDTGRLQSVFGKQHWWTRRQRFTASVLDFSAPGEIRLRESGAIAA